MCSVIVCRGNVTCGDVLDSVVLVDGDIDLQRADDSSIRNSVIRATGEIRLPKNAKPKDCIIEANVKNATAPYKFFEIRDVGLSATVDAKECAVANLTAIGTAGLQLCLSPTRAVYDLIVTDAKSDTPIGNCGLAKGDRIRAIDDVRFESPDDFRKKLRRAMVRQGDCLLTVLRDGKTIDLPVFFPMPK